MAGVTISGGPSRVAAVWGDGFAGDGFGAVCAVTGWDNLSTDEYAVLFPRLVPADGRLPAAPAAHLAACVAARAARLGPASGSAAAARPGRARLAGDGPLSALLRAAGLLRDASERTAPDRAPPERAAEERRLLNLLDGLLGDVRRGLAPAWSEDREAWFAFGSGIHPGYLWPVGAISPERGLTAAWLGHLDRGRTALMPEAVAGYLLDAVLAGGSGAGPDAGLAAQGARGRDRALAAMVGGPEDARRLRRAAVARLAGGDPAVRFGRDRHRAASRLSRMMRAVVPVREDALEHA